MILSAPVGPGLVEPVGIDDWRRMPAGVAFAPMASSGSIALDGERELSVSERDEVAVTLIDNAFPTINVAAIMKFSAVHGLMRQSDRLHTEPLT